MANNMYAGGGRPPISELSFRKYDVNGDGKLDKEELRMACLDHGVPVSEEELDMSWELLDADGSGGIEYEEFKKLWETDGRWQKLRRSESDMAVLRQCAAFFAHFDKDGNRTLDRDEFAQLHATLTEAGYTRLGLKECLDELDTNGDNVITLGEYVGWMHRIGSIQLENTSGV